MPIEQTRSGVGKPRIDEQHTKTFGFSIFLNEISTFRGLFRDRSEDLCVGFDLLHWLSLAHESVHIADGVNKVLDFVVPVHLRNKSLG